MKPKNKKKMPTTYDVELSIVGGLFIAGFNGENALCNALAYTRDNPLASGEYAFWDRATDQHWVGGRPGKP